MKAVILQPMYLPWMGYFGMIEQADVFVFYNDVQFVRRSWQRRNKIKVPNGDTWLTVPVEKDHGQKINEVEIKRDNKWREKHWKSIGHSYRGTTGFEEYSEKFEEIYSSQWKNLLDLNVEIIHAILDCLDGVGEDTEFMFSSEIDAAGKKTDRLINILNEIGADEYISGPGAKDYINSDKFIQEDIELMWHEFDHPKYDQKHGKFVSHLSAIDLLFNKGYEASNILKRAEKGSLVSDRDY